MRPITPQRILIIDDELVVRQLLASVLGSHYKIVTLASGKDLKPLFETLDPDLVILDITMPEFSGYDIAREIRHWPTGATVPMMFLSGHYHKVEAAHEMEATQAHLMAKPFDVRQLRHDIATLLWRNSPLINPLQIPPNPN